MNTTTTETQGNGLTTADLAAAARKPAAERENRKPQAEGADEQLAPLFPPDVAEDFRDRWDAVQTGFVDDPKQAVQQGDELVAQVMQSLADTFSKERAQRESQLENPDGASTENLRIALRRYRSFFKRLLSL
jgi:hypothetical protein